jgi:drug/metabolite transporter (DMT)-like permease
VLEAPVASAIAIVFLGEILTTTQFIGMGLILVAIVLPTAWKGKA